MRAPSSALLLGALALSACVEEQRYVVENASFALTADAAPVFVNDDGDMLFVSQETRTFPISAPSPAGLEKLAREAQGKNWPFPRAPWVEATDIDYTLDFVVQNSGAARVSVLVALDGVSEFFVYTPQPEDLHQWERRFTLEPGSRARGTVSVLEMEEIARDLATAVNGAPNSNLVVQFQSQSGRDDRVSPYIPSIIPGLVGVVASVSTTSAAAVTLEFTVRADDRADRLSRRGKQAWTLPAPQTFVPITPIEVEE